MKKLLISFVVLALCIPQSVFASTQILMSRYTASTGLAASSSFYLFPVYSTGGFLSATYATSTVAVAPISGTLSNFYAYVDGALTSDSYTLALTVNGVDTAMTCTINAPGSSCSDQTHSVTLNQGDSFAIHINTGTDRRQPSISMRFTPTTPNETMMIAHAGGTVFSNSVNNFLTFNRPSTPGSSGPTTSIFADAGVLDLLDAYATSTLTSGTYTFSLEKNGSTGSASTCVLSTSASFCRDTTNSISLAAGDFVNIQSTPASSPSTRAPTLSARFVPTTSGIFELLPAPNTSYAAATNYAPVVGYPSVFTAGSVEASSTLYAQPMVIHSMRVKTSSNVGGSGASVVFTLRRNGADTALTCSIATGASTCNVTADVVYGQGDTIVIKHSVTGSPATVAAGIALSASALISNTPAAVPAKRNFSGGLIRFIGGMIRFK